LRESGQVDIASGYDGYYLTSTRASAEGRSDGASGGALGDDVRALRGQPDRTSHFVERHDD
jgi:hypothetical protein